MICRFLTATNGFVLVNRHLRRSMNSLPPRLWCRTKEGGEGHIGNNIVSNREEDWDGARTSSRDRGQSGTLKQVQCCGNWFHSTDRLSSIGSSSSIFSITHYWSFHMLNFPAFTQSRFIPEVKMLNPHQDRLAARHCNAIRSFHIF